MMKTVSCRRLLKAALLGCALSCAAPDFAAAQTSRQNREFQPFLTRGTTTWAVDAGIRINNFDWNIASDITGTATPNILSELTWTDVTLLEIGGEVRHEEPIDVSFIKGGLHLEGRLTAGLPIDGENQDSDFLGDNRTLEFSRTLADSDGGYAVSASAAVGYKIYLTGDPEKRARALMNTPTPRTAKGRERKARAVREALERSRPAVTITPLLGYAIDQQEYTMTNVDQIIPALGPLAVDDFDWHYLSNWYGAFFGLEGDIRYKKNMLRLRGEYQDVTFYGEGFWRGRAGFRQDPSFTHEAEGDGYLFNAEYAYALGDDYAITFEGLYETRTTDPGIDRTFFTNNDVGVIRLNEVNDESYGLNVGFRYNW